MSGSPETSDHAAPAGLESYTFGEYSSPPCYMHEFTEAPPLDPTNLPPPAADPPPWAAVRTWRKDMRAALIERRMQMPAAERAAGSTIISEKLAAGLDLPGRLCVSFYWPMRGEYDPRPLLNALRERDVQLALPVVVAKGQPLMFRPWSPGVAMTRGVWNIPIPAEGEPITPDVLLAPLVGFDPAGYRLGYGGGYFDRTIAALPAKPLCIGVGFALGYLETIYPQPHDRPMDIIYTNT